MSSQSMLVHSQNFIRRPELVRELLELAQIGPNDLVIEIGPGKGMITRELLKRAKHVIAVERDPKFTEELSLLTTQSNFQLIISDFLEWRLPQGQVQSFFSNISITTFTADIVIC